MAAKRGTLFAQSAKPRTTFSILPQPRCLCIRNPHRDTLYDRMTDADGCYDFIAEIGMRNLASRAPLLRDRNGSYGPVTAYVPVIVEHLGVTAGGVPPRTTKRAWDVQELNANLGAGNSLRPRWPLKRWVLPSAGGKLAHAFALHSDDLGGLRSRWPLGNKRHPIDAATHDDSLAGGAKVFDVNSPPSRCDIYNATLDDWGMRLLDLETDAIADLHLLTPISNHGTRLPSTT
jgi:hypothetical protein